LSAKAWQERSFKTRGDGDQIPSWEGQKPKASGWVSATKNPPRRAIPPETGFQGNINSRAKFRFYK